MEERPLEVKGKGEDDVECYHVSLKQTINNTKQMYNEDISHCFNS